MESTCRKKRMAPCIQIYVSSAHKYEERYCANTRDLISPEGFAQTQESSGHGNTKDVFVYRQMKKNGTPTNMTP